MGTPSDTLTSNLSSPRIDYGIDAPQLSRNLALGGFVGLTAGILLPHRGLLNALSIALATSGGSFLLTSCLMFLYSKIGKYRHRDRILSRLSWKGDEQVLDVGTGRGLLLIGAAKRLTSGKVIGIDIWNAEDLSNNSREQTLNNAQLEGVSDKVDVLSEDVRELSFPSDSFDVVLSNLCIHNIYHAEGRKLAIQEIARVLKPGGVALISDMRHIGEYVDSFIKAGLKVERFGPYWLSTFPPLTIVKATKTQ